MPDNAIAEGVVQERRRFRSIGGYPILLKPAIPFILFQHKKELSQKFW
jgi:hypothetical protein